MVDISNDRIGQLYKEYIKDNKDVKFILQYGYCRNNEYVENGECIHCDEETTRPNNDLIEDGNTRCNIDNYIWNFNGAKYYFTSGGLR